MSNTTKIPPVGAELFQVDGQTDTMKLIVAFGKFAKAPTNAPQQFSLLVHQSDADDWNFSLLTANSLLT